MPQPVRRSFSKLRSVRGGSMRLPGTVTDLAGLCLDICIDYLKTEIRNSQAGESRGDLCASDNPS